MTCYHPRQAFFPNPSLTVSKKLIFDPESPDIGLPVKIPCRECVGCRLEYSRQWALRIVCESKCYDRNSYITLTYSDQFLPKGGTLVLEHFQKFMKRLRKRFGNGIRFFSLWRIW